MPHTPKHVRAGRTRPMKRHSFALVHPVAFPDGDSSLPLPGLLTSNLQPPEDPDTAPAQAWAPGGSSKSNPIRMLDMSDRVHSFTHSPALLESPSLQATPDVTCPMCQHRFVPAPELSPAAPPSRLSIKRRGSGFDFGVVKPLIPRRDVTQAPCDLAHAQAAAVAELRAAAAGEGGAGSEVGQVNRSLGSVSKALRIGSARTNSEGGAPGGGYASQVMASLRAHEMRNLRKSVFSDSLSRTSMRDFYDVGAIINCGLSAEVFEGVSKVDRGEVALKVYFQSDRAAVHEVITEHVCMTRAQSEHVLHCYGVMFDGHRPGLVLQKAARSLRDLLQELPATRNRGTPAALTEATADGASPFTSTSTVDEVPPQDPAVSSSPSLRSASSLPTAISSVSARNSMFTSTSSALPQSQLMRIAVALLQGVARVHACGLAHCDIKPENIMMMEDGALKLCDFGAAVAIDPATGRVAAMPAEICDLENQFAEQLGGPAPPSMAAMTPYSLRKVTQGTDVYNAPERSNKSDMRKVDVWAIGCVLYELCSGGQRLFRWSSEQQKYMQLSQLFSGSWTPPPLPANAAGWQEVIDAMLTVEPALRPLPSDVLKLGIFGKMYFRHTGASAGTGRVRRSLVLPARLNAVVPCQQEAVKGAVAKLDELETAVTL